LPPLRTSIPLPTLYIIYFIRPRPPTSPLFPYTTLFRSSVAVQRDLDHRGRSRDAVLQSTRPTADIVRQRLRETPRRHLARRGVRSEEHTSELQSPDHLVCRLLLEKKKHTTELFCYHAYS